MNINEAYAAAWASVDAPMGGFKDSGVGRRHGAEGIVKYTESQTVSAQRGLPLALDAAPLGMTEECYGRVVTGALKITNHALKVAAKVPGLR